ncbi:MAG: ubiquinone biosynthesis regulatory protein kinase UbiB [Spongiibacteraceae bacterium]
MSRIRRAFTIIAATARYRLDLLFDADTLPAPLNVLMRCSPLRLLPAPKLSRAERLRLTLESLGPIFVKFGQILSTRRDLLPDDIADELAKLQDQVPPFASDVAVKIIEDALGEPVTKIFAQFDAQPLASASVAQVHPATLHSGRAVVVKVLRPGIEKIIRQDIALLYSLARFAERYIPEARRLRPVEVVEEYEYSVLDELNLMHEAGNTAQLRRNWLDSKLLYIPEVFWDYTRTNVLVMERIHGIPVTDVAALRANGTDMKLLAERGVEIFFTQVLRDSFFHADMHPGNIFVSYENPHDPQYIGIDCAIMGTLTDFDQYYLARNLHAIFRRDYHEVAQLHVECGWVPAHTRVHEFESAIRTVCEPNFDKPLGEISFGHMLLYLFQTARRFDMQVQPSLVLLQKTLLNIEGLGRQLYPQLDLWSTASPLVEKWLRDRYSPRNLLKKVRHKLPQWLEQFPEVPDYVLAKLQTPTAPLTPPASLPQHPAPATPTRRREKFAWLLIIASLVYAMAPTLQLPSLSWLGVALGALILLSR